MSRLQLWILAARPPTLWAAVTPVLVGSALAFNQRVLRPGAFLAALIGALAIQVAANFANDASDAHRGADTPDRIGPPRAVATGMLTARQVWTGTAIAVALAAGLHATRADGSPMTYNHENPYLPDLLICRKEYAQAALAALAEADE